MGMESFSNALKKLWESFIQTPEHAQTTEVTHSPDPQTTVISHTPQRQQAFFTIPPSPTLQDLATHEIQEKARTCLSLIGESPTVAQWEMILSPDSSIRVVAGAGSGKSTTLILRLLILHKLLRIPLDELHVFSFTKASTREFQKKLAAKLIQWEEVIEHQSLTDQRRVEIQTLSKRTVSTFHSVIAHLCRDVLPGGSLSLKFFDLLGNTILEEETDLGSYNPFVNPHLSDQQEAVLNAAHTAAYEQSPRYRALLTTLLQEQERQRWLRAAQNASQDEAFEQWKWLRLLRQEYQYHGFTPDGRYAPSSSHLDQRHFHYIDMYRSIVANRLLEWGIDFAVLAPVSIRCPIPGGFPGQFFASFKIGNQLFLHVERYRSSQQIPKAEIGISFHERDRRRFLALYSDNPDQHQLLGPEDFDSSGGRPVLTPHGDFKLNQWLSLNGYAVAIPAAPSLRVQLPGDIHRYHIAELLYQEGLFIESLGLEVEQLRVQDRQLDPVSSAIAEALPHFWRAFQQELRQRGLLRFHDVLTNLRNEQTLQKVRGNLKHLRHLFIDEFQDISPEIVDWLVKTLRIHITNHLEVSVIAIGDDYQSIYGWRGSHPTFLMHFERHFLSESMSQIVLTENFRSRQPIIDAAEAVLSFVHQKIRKHGKSVFDGQEEKLLDPVRLVEAPLSWGKKRSEEDIWQTFSAYVSRLLSDLETSGYLSSLIGKRDVLSVFILARTNATIDSILSSKKGLRDQLLKALSRQGIKRFREIDIVKGTFHRAKGLEADVVLLLDDSQPPEEHPLRELVFRQSPFLGREAGTYTQTMHDESRRLAYVALTRARLGVMWVPLTGTSTLEEDDLQPASNRNDRVQTVSAQGCFVLVKNYLKAVGRE